jgi:hypothetical protein
MIDCDCEDFYMFECMDCHCCTNCNYEYYMVHDEVWDKVATQGMLCIGCLESRLKRLLNKNDFTDAPINYFGTITGSPRYKARLKK